MDINLNMNILLTNDDGIYADGLLALKAAMENVGRVYVVAPDRPRSACGHSITLHKPLRANKVKLRDGSIGYASNGTPSDCVSLAILGIIEEKVDLVISGINAGPNLGWDLTYSGTVSAAMEGAIMGAKSFAISVATYETDVDYSVAADFAVAISHVLMEHELPESTLLNVNIPALPVSAIQGIQITKQGKRRYKGSVQKRSDPMGHDYYWLGGEMPQDELSEGTDVKAIADDYVSITPVHLDLTDVTALGDIRTWGLEQLRITAGPGTQAKRAT